MRAIQHTIKLRVNAVQVALSRFAGLLQLSHLVKACGPCASLSVALPLTAPSEPKPLFSAEYLADRELNRTGDTPADLQSALSATAHKKKKGKGPSRPNSVINAFNPADDATATSNGVSISSHGSPQHNLTRNSDPSESSSGEHAVVGQVFVEEPQQGSAGVRAKGDLEAGQMVERAGSGRGLALPFTPMAVAFKDISYFVPHPSVSDVALLLPVGMRNGLRRVAC
jgi:hypothetical protein